jgi:hypothetical protein
MAPPLDTRLDRVEARRTAAAADRGSAAIRRRRMWRAEAAIGALIRRALARGGIDAARATRLCIADEAAAALSALPDPPELQRADDNDAGIRQRPRWSAGGCFRAQDPGDDQAICRREAARFRQCLVRRTIRLVARSAGSGIALPFSKLIPFPNTAFGRRYARAGVVTPRLERRSECAGRFLGVGHAPSAGLGGLFMVGAHWQWAQDAGGTNC